jgi:hypothetical protein
MGVFLASAKVAYLCISLTEKASTAVFWLITVAIAQLVRASDCGSEGRRFEPG